MTKLNWNTIGKEQDWPKPCCCKFVCSGVEMDESDCPVHKPGMDYTCCGSRGNEPCASKCRSYRPKHKTPSLRLEYLGEPTFATSWSACVCGHPAQCHG